MTFVTLYQLFFFRWKCLITCFFLLSAVVCMCLDVGEGLHCRLLMSDSLGWMDGWMEYLRAGCGAWRTRFLAGGVERGFTGVYIPF
ncbi:hypothetical protein EDC01DRAFT_669186 [Geopyxis carbonaria]|nr:hypothetical protein EDC01DRAFT_669186 [Geopyxis carbonaria]